jgi:hypothetical protein
MVPRGCGRVRNYRQGSKGGSQQQTWGAVLGCKPEGGGGSAAAEARAAGADVRGADAGCDAESLPCRG